MKRVKSTAVLPLLPKPLLPKAFFAQATIAPAYIAQVGFCPSDHIAQAVSLPKKTIAQVTFCPSGIFAQVVLFWINICLNSKFLYIIYKCW